MDNEWKKSLRERFSDYASPEPEGLWEGIEQGIAGKPRRKMRPVWIASGLAAAAAVALVVFLHPEKTLETPGLQKQATLAESVQAEPADTVVDSVRNRLLGGGHGLGRLGLRQQGLAGYDGEGNGLGSGSGFEIPGRSRG